LALDGEDAVQGGGGDAQALGGGDVVLHRLVDAPPADHQDAGAAEIVAGDVEAVLMLLGDGIVEETGGEQEGADGGIACVIHLTAVPGGGFSVLNLAAAPGGGDVSKGAFHGMILSPGGRVKNKTANCRR